MKFIDATNSVYGRLSAYVAKELLNGEEVVIVNAEKAIITGKPEYIIGEFKKRREIGSVRKGPYYPRVSEEILRRSIGQMLPKKTTRGKEALHRCRVYRGVPSFAKNEKIEKVERTVSDKVVGMITLGDLSKELGGL
ncbi:MAG: 50S ribosomal protein L13 [Thermoplasmata archaeon]